MKAAKTPKPLRVVLYSHDSQGLGHSRRNLALAHALSRGLPGLTGRPVSGLLITGEPNAPRFCAPVGWDWVLLPGIQKGPNGYEPRHLQVGQPKLVRIRSRILAAVTKQFKPHLVIVDRHAFGVDNELARALGRLRTAKPNCRVVLGLREVLDSPSAARREWRALGDLSRVREAFDEVWVYGDPAVHDPLSTGEVPQELEDLVRFTGYLAANRHSAQPGPESRSPYVLTLAGGGSDGLEVTLTAARAEVPAGYEHLVVTGPNMPMGHRAEVERAAGASVTVVGSVRDALPEIRDAAAVVSMGGYNSVCEIMSTTTPALIVPRTSPRREQLIRAKALADRGLIDLCRPEAFTPEALGAWFRSAAGSSTTRAGISLSGLETVCGLAAGLLASPVTRRRSAPAVIQHPGIRSDWRNRAAV